MAVFERNCVFCHSEVLSPSPFYRKYSENFQENEKIRIRKNECLKVISAVRLGQCQSIWHAICLYHFWVNVVKPGQSLLDQVQRMERVVGKINSPIRLLINKVKGGLTGNRGAFHAPHTEDQFFSWFITKNTVDDLKMKFTRLPAIQVDTDQPSRPPRVITISSDSEASSVRNTSDGTSVTETSSSSSSSENTAESGYESEDCEVHTQPIDYSIPRKRARPLIITSESDDDGSTGQTECDCPFPHHSTLNKASEKKTESILSADVDQVNSDQTAQAVATIASPDLFDISPPSVISNNLDFSPSFWPSFVDANWHSSQSPILEKLLMTPIPNEEKNTSIGFGTDMVADALSLSGLLPNEEGRIMTFNEY